jgi:hypothetical protein
MWNREAQNHMDPTDPDPKTKNKKFTYFSSPLTLTWDRMSISVLACLRSGMTERTALSARPSRIARHVSLNLWPLHSKKGFFQKAMEHCVYPSTVQAVFLESAIINQFLYQETII